jgi:hypothetical protein
MLIGKVSTRNVDRKIREFDFFEVTISSDIEKKKKGFAKLLTKIK